MQQRIRVGIAVAFVVALFTAVQLGALALVGPFESAGFQSVEDPQDPANSLLYLGILLGATLVMLAAMKYGRGNVIRWFIILTSGLISSYVFVVTLPALPVGGTNVAPAIGGLAIVLALALYPEWWVIDVAGVVMGIGAAGIFGISFGVLPAILLLTVLAVYDAISVYGTEHMLTLASGVMDMKVPVLFVVPTSLDYSFRSDDAGMDDTGAGSGTYDESESATSSGTASETSVDATEATDDTAETAEDDPDPLQRDALFIGLGDAVMPAILTASAAFFVDTPAVLGIELAALGALVGTIVGLLILLRMVLRGRAHAGLPLLNGGAILGYLLAAVAGGLTLVEALGLAPYL